MPRNEIEARLTSLVGRLGAEIERVNDGLARVETRVTEQLRDITSRLDVTQGRDTGSRDRKTEGRLDVGAVVGLIGGMVAVLALILVLIND